MKLYEFFAKHKWCRTVLSMNSDGKRVEPNEPEAEKFCMLGGLMKCCNYQTWKEAEDSPEGEKIKQAIDSEDPDFRTSMTGIGAYAIGDYNDTLKSKDDLLAFLNKHNL